MAGMNIRLRILSYVIAAAAGAGLTFALSQKQPETTDNKAVAPEPARTAPTIPIIPVPTPPLDRAALLAASARAADAVASGSALPEANAGLVGRSFVLKLPFGCRGEMNETQDKEGNERPAEESWAGWTFNPTSRALQLTARTTDFAQEDWARALAGDLKFDAAEGFWIRHPWTAADHCLANETGASAESAKNMQTLAIAQFFRPDGPRTLRRSGRPYRFTMKLDEGMDPSAEGYQLRLEGRVAAFADGQPIHCYQESVSARPRCLIAAEFERVAFIAPANEKLLVEWH
jgi:hypothetical protein